ncbi:hypothetical protein Emed_000823 [Eimeria media]
MVEYFTLWWRANGVFLIIDLKALAQELGAAVEIRLQPAPAVARQEEDVSTQDEWEVRQGRGDCLNRDGGQGDLKVTLPTVTLRS